MASSTFLTLVDAGVSASDAQVAHYVDLALGATIEGVEIQELIKQYNGGMVTFAELINKLSVLFIN